MNKNSKKLKTKNYKLQTSKGFVLIFSVIISSILLSVGLSMFSIALKELILSASGRNSQFSFYAADSAIECALYWDIRHPSYPASVFGSTGTTLLNGLEGYWKLDDGSGLSVSDSSSNSNNGTLTNMDPFTDWVSGKINSALDFDGSNDYVGVGYDNALDLTGDVTVSAWINVGVEDKDHKILGNQDGSSGGYKMSIFSNKVEFEIRDSSNAAHLNRGESGGTYLNAGQWYHVVGMYSDTDDYIKTYVNGTSDREASISGVLSSTSGSMKFGREPFQNNFFFDGAIDEIRVYNRILTDGEISDLYSLTAPSSSFSPVNQNSNVLCNEADITNPATGWDSATGWDVSNLSDDSATVVFDMAFANGSCATVTVIKDSGSTRIDSRGYNTCDLDYTRRVERGLRVRY